MTANSLGLENNHTGKLNAGAAKKWPAFSNILNHITVSSRNSISHSSKLHGHFLVSMDESMDTVRSPEVEYIDDHKSTVVDSIEKKDKKRPSTDFMAKVHKDINPSMRAILIDWLVEVNF
ncbi:hypothetical protein H5410_026424 [Solanum commersonii]|uniref:Cyclin N-terminal domain-containing protein n=1 Tax=Solanum commersonii TaxID=4109 RepID=A0A9J5Z0P6_SOLCO|nr:hypothetical protein H5410_026424 [Solanum commersonii]